MGRVEGEEDEDEMRRGSVVEVRDKDGEEERGRGSEESLEGKGGVRSVSRS